MKVNGKAQTTIWFNEEVQPHFFSIIDQRQLPHNWVIKEINASAEAAIAIKEMWVRGAPLIGATAACGMYLALIESKNVVQPAQYMSDVAANMLSTRPTAINLKWGIERILNVIKDTEDKDEQIKIAFEECQRILEKDVEICSNIGDFGLMLIEEIAASKPNQVVNILTHCNAGWLACIDWGTATAPIYKAYNKGIKVHVWVDETRPRLQGANLTAWELNNHGVPHSVITDNTGGLLMMKGMVDICLVGTDRTTVNGDVCNKIGTYLKALAAHDNNIPFYVGLPSSTIDWSINSGKDIPIEIRDEEEVKYIWGDCDGENKRVLITPKDSPAVNYGFDITPAKYVTGLITERGICEASQEGLLSLFPEKRD